MTLSIFCAPQIVGLRSRNGEKVEQLFKCNGYVSKAVSNLLLKMGRKKGKTLR